jgi:hypothetical protein
VVAAGVLFNSSTATSILEKKKRFGNQKGQTKDR